MQMNRLSTALFLGLLAVMAIYLNWSYWRNRISATPDDWQQKIVADLSNLPPTLGNENAPVLIEVTLFPRYAGPCDKATVAFVQHLVKDHPGKVRAHFHILDRHDVECSAHLTINGKQTFTIQMEGKQANVTLHGIARPGDPMSEVVRQIVEQEIAKAEKEVKDAKSEAS